MEWQPVDEWADPDPWHERPVESRGRYAPHRSPAPYERRDGAADRYASPSGGYGPVRYEGHDVPPERYERYDRPGVDRHALRTSGPYDPTAYDPAAYDPRGYDPRYDPTAYDPLTDTGRHHRRLAPAGW